jgi:hypothetical protein
MTCHVARGTAKRPWMPLLLVIALWTWSGCGQDDRPELGSVQGVVTLDNQPLAEAVVQFDPGTVRGSKGMTDAGGRYELLYIRNLKGAAVGEHTVRITTQTETKPEILPARYHSQTTLKKTVNPGCNEIDFPLTSQ